MTVSYMAQASHAGIFTFPRLMFRWRGSVWKVVGYEVCLWMWLYMTIAIVYHFVIKGTDAGYAFERFVILCNAYVATAQSSLSFVLGFYVNIVANRWWEIFMTIPWPDTPCLLTAAFMRSRGKKYRRDEVIQRRSIVRYLVLSLVMVLRDISERVRIRFPELEYLKQSLITEEEYQLIIKVQERQRSSVFWLPLMWIMKLYKQMNEEHHVLDEVHFVTLCQALRSYRDGLNNLLSYDWICTPLVYTQVVNLATAFYTMILVFSSQYLVLNEDELLEHQLAGSQTALNYQVDYVFPFFAIFHVIFYVGWLKVAQVTLNPFGTDDDDFEVDYLIERNLKTGYAMMDEQFDVVPTLVDLNVVNLPHTRASAKRVVNPMVGSVANLRVGKKGAAIVPSDLTNTAENEIFFDVVAPQGAKVPPAAPSMVPSMLPVETQQNVSCEQPTQPPSVNLVTCQGDLTPVASTTTPAVGPSAGPKSHLGKSSSGTDHTKIVTLHGAPGSKKIKSVITQQESLLVGLTPTTSIIGQEEKTQDTNTERRMEKTQDTYILDSKKNRRHTHTPHNSEKKQSDKKTVHAIVSKMAPPPAKEKSKIAQPPAKDKSKMVQPPAKEKSKMAQPPAKEKSKVKAVPSKLMPASSKVDESKKQV